MSLAEGGGGEGVKAAWGARNRDRSPLPVNPRFAPRVSLAGTTEPLALSLAAGDGGGWGWGGGQLIRRGKPHPHPRVSPPAVSLPGWSL